MAARKCLDKAKAMMMPEWNAHPDGYPCDCQNGKVTVTFETYGSDKPPQKYEMPCYMCKGSGIMTFDGLLQRYIGCKCHNEYNCFHASDGHEVFGNDTYICGICGMVTQFG
jgi:hypothetical protein